MKKLSDQEVKKLSEESPNQAFDICSVCDGTELHGQMNEVNEVDWDLICDDCGYDMGVGYSNCGMSEDGVCPECGHDAEEDNNEST